MKSIRQITIQFFEIGWTERSVESVSDHSIVSRNDGQYVFHVCKNSLNPFSFIDECQTSTKQRIVLKHKT